MSKIIISCSGGKHIAKKVAKSAGFSYGELNVEKFPDGELNIKFEDNLEGKDVFLVQSFHDNINEDIVEVLFAGNTAVDLGAKKVFLVALYLPYLRQDKRFDKGQCISAEVLGDLFRMFKNVFVVTPHLHRIKNAKEMEHVIHHGVKIDAGESIADYIKKNKLDSSLIIGPDMESKQWVEPVAKALGKDYSILKKIRHSATDVDIEVPNFDVKGKEVIIIDDMISTGGTMLKTIKGLKKLKPSKIYCFCIHGIFVNNALEKLQKECSVVASNTLINKVGKIDISKVVADKLKKWKS